MGCKQIQTWTGKIPLDFKAQEQISLAQCFVLWAHPHGGQAFSALESSLTHLSPRKQTHTLWHSHADAWLDGLCLWAQGRSDSPADLWSTFGLFLSFLEG